MDARGESSQFDLNGFAAPPRRHVMNMQATGQTIAAPRPALSPIDLSIPRSKGVVVGFWIVTALFCLQIGFTAYAQLRLPQVAEAFTHLGFPAYFRVELSWAKLLGVVLLLAPVPARLKEWAYAGFAITLGSALIAHLSVGNGPEAWGWAAATAAIWGLSYFLWRRVQATPASAQGRT
jgi:DoxX-like family